MFRTINILRFILNPRDKKQLLCLSFFSAVSALWEVAGIGLVLPVVAAVVNPELLQQNCYLKAFYQLFSGCSHRAFMFFSAVLVIVNFGLKNLYGYWLICAQSRFIFRRQHELSVRLFGLFMKGEYTLLLGNPPSELCARVQRVKTACEGTLLPMMLLGSDALAVAALTAALLFFMPLSMMGAMVVLLVMAWAFYLPFRRINSRLSEEFVKYNNLTMQDVMTGFNGIKAVKTSGCEDFLIDRYRENITGGHGGMDTLTLDAFCDAVRNRTAPPIDVYDCAAWMAITCLSEQSISMGSMPVAFPDFTDGKWIYQTIGNDTKWSLDEIFE